MAAPPVPSCFQPPADVEKGQVLLVPGHGRRRQQAGRAVAGVGLADGAKGLRRCRP